ncbi:DUF434 domain-containing protein [Clostridium manihotivorum]|uniref:DUF434 domain-containing protein n=1 Tax=Clostridium manihotivorum TaxID=2320868 RepID=A0A410DXC8_9CLOT|nr:DUF434 domain-containing protein [Clostridium manihotivorum]QAA33705.1 DUF434 domain-containing protein [Clostridium manihotivorum]
MSKVVKRGYVPSDEKEFSIEAIEKLNKGARDLYYLINQGYNTKSASVFVGNHYLFSERQRMALARAISPKESINIRKDKEVLTNLKGASVNADGFNTIITLEVALSDSTIIKCMDGTFRDLAGLRGTYRLIDKTELAIDLIGEALENLGIAKVSFYLDSQVSNSGKLKLKILELLDKYSFEVVVENINNVDSTLEKLDYVITTDAIILDKCSSWINLNKRIIEENIKTGYIIDFSKIRDLE